MRAMRACLIDELNPDELNLDELNLDELNLDELNLHSLPVLTLTFTLASVAHSIPFSQL